MLMKNEEKIFIDFNIFKYIFLCKMTWVEELGLLCGSQTGSLPMLSPHETGNKFISLLAHTQRWKYHVFF